MREVIQGVGKLFADDRSAFLRGKDADNKGISRQSKQKNIVKGNDRMNKIENTIPQGVIKALAKKFGKSVTDAAFETIPLHGGTLGTVNLLSGVAKMSDGAEHPFKVVHKTQKKWERNFDVNSWRREYDLYTSELDVLFNGSLRWPQCYHAELTQDELQIWMEYIDGVSGQDLTSEMYECAAEELGRFQGKLFSQKPGFLKDMTNLSAVDYTKKRYLHYRSWPEVYDYIRAESCEIPKHLCKMLIDIDERSDEIWGQIESLPIVLCHRDFWITNIFYTSEGIRLIDWDTAGWGYLGEDIASLIADEADVAHMAEYYKRCVQAYYNGFSEYSDIAHISRNCIWEMIIVMFGYRLVEWYKFSESAEEKQVPLDTLQKIYEIGSKAI